LTFLAAKLSFFIQLKELLAQPTMPLVQAKGSLVWRLGLRRHSAALECRIQKPTAHPPFIIPAKQFVCAKCCPAAVTAVAPGIKSRFRTFVHLIKASPNYNLAIGQGARH
jgi:hypothetical protein